MVLYRKYRPQTFGEIVNQKGVIKTLTNALKSGKVAHAYLFSGPRGTGKTTTGRLLAKALNCEKRERTRKSGRSLYEPCNQCFSCQQISQGRALDLVEIDAASNRGIDEIRQLKENIRLGPTSFAWKVFILDEVHMLTPEASNALLKSLEEPPSQTVFILVTTHPHKLLPTIVSRCQRLEFGRLLVKDIMRRLEFIACQEKIEVEPRALRAIAINAQGSLRDAESMLGQFLSLGRQKVTWEDLRDVLGIIDEHLVIKLVEYLGKKEIKKALDFTDKLAQKGIDFQQFLLGMISYIRKMLLIKTDSALSQLFQDKLTKEELDVIIRQAQNFSLSKLLTMMDIFIEAQKDLEKYPFAQMALEMAVFQTLGE